MVFCGLDVGTSGVKAVVFDKQGNILANCFNAYELTFKSDGTRDLPPEEIWQKTQNVLAGARRECGQEIAALAVSSFGEAFIAVDKNGDPLCEVMLFTDRRGESEYYEAMKGIGDEKIAKICGLPPSPMISASKILYLQKQRPEIWEKIDKLLLIEDFIYFKLGGRAYTDYSLACRTMLFDVHRLCWSDELLEKMNVPKSMLSEPVCSGTVVGEVIQPYADKLGLAGTKLVMGGHDQPVHACGAGREKNAMVCSMGTTECLTPVFDKPLPYEVTLKSSLSTEPFVTPDKYCTIAFNVTAGLLVKWFFDTFEKGEQKYAEYEQNAPKGPTKLFVQPYLMGSGTPYMDNLGRYAVIGADIGTTTYDIYKASLEGLCFDQRLNLEYLRAQGMHHETLIAAGGGSKSELWLQIKADVLQTPVQTLTCKEVGALGCAILCAVALGEYADITEAARAMSEVKSVFMPNADNKAEYDEKFALYETLHADLKKYCAYACKTNW